jgi:CRISPR-associated protein Csm1
MSEQILLQGKILGTEEFLLSRPGAASPGRSNGEELLAGRSQYVTLLCEVLPRALLAEFGLARVLLGSSGGGQFLLVLPGEVRSAAEEFLAAAARQTAEISGQHLQLLWGVTENLGDWSVVRKRLNEAFERTRVTPLAAAAPEAFRPFIPAELPNMDAYFSKELGLNARESVTVGWSPEAPAMVHPGEGKHTWTVTSNLSLEGITLARHAAPSEDGKSAAGLPTLARRAQGRSLWGVLRGDVDNFGVRLRRLTSIEEHVRLSVLYKQFFAGEIEVLCSMPEFWRKVTILYTGGDDFAVYGSWDALLPLARELQRLFHRFTEEYLGDFPGPEAKTISMAIALAPEMHYPLAAVYEEAGRNLELAKAADKDCIFVLGRVLEWKQLADAADLKDSITKLVSDSRLSRQFLQDLRGFYQRQAGHGDDQRNPSRDRRFQRRISRILSGTRNREFLKLRTLLINEIVGRKAAGEVKLRPAGLVGLEWARMTTEV